MEELPSLLTRKVETCAYSARVLHILHHDRQTKMLTFVDTTGNTYSIDTDTGIEVENIKAILEVDVCVLVLLTRLVFLLIHSHLGFKTKC